MERRSIREEIKLYGTLLGLSEAQCDEIASGGTRAARIAAMRDLRGKYRRLTKVEPTKQLSAVDQVRFWSQVPGADRFVYFVQAGDAGPVKIGLATDPLARLAQLQTGNHEQLHLRGVLPGDRTVEGQLHHRFREARIRGEWFGRAYLKVIVAYGESAAAQHMTAYRENGGLPWLVGGKRVMSAAKRREMEVDLARLVHRFGYSTDPGQGSCGIDTVNGYMWDSWKLDADEVEAEIERLELLSRHRAA